GRARCCSGSDRSSPAASPRAGPGGRWRTTWDAASSRADRRGRARGRAGWWPSPGRTRAAARPRCSWASLLTSASIDAHGCLDRTFAARGRADGSGGLIRATLTWEEAHRTELLPSAEDTEPPGRNKVEGGRASPALEPESGHPTCTWPALHT